MCVLVSHVDKALLPLMGRGAQSELPSWTAPLALQVDGRGYKVCACGRWRKVQHWIRHGLSGGQRKTTTRDRSTTDAKDPTSIKSHNGVSLDFRELHKWSTRRSQISLHTELVNTVGSSLSSGTALSSECGGETTRIMFAMVTDRLCETKRLHLVLDLLHEPSEELTVAWLTVSFSCWTAHCTRIEDQSSSTNKLAWRTTLSLQARAAVSRVVGWTPRRCVCMCIVGEISFGD